MPQNVHILNTRYARALLSLAEEAGILDRTCRDMKTVHDVFRRHKELVVVMRSPVVRLSKKQNILVSVFRNDVHPLVLQYMRIIVRKQRGYMLEGIAGAYVREYKKHLGIETVRVTTAIPLDKELREHALEAARKLTPCTIEFEETVDPGIIGGFILNLEDKQYNASVKHRLQRMKKHLRL